MPSKENSSEEEAGSYLADGHFVSPQHSGRQLTCEEAKLSSEGPEKLLSSVWRDPEHESREGWFPFGITSKVNWFPNDKVFKMMLPMLPKDMGLGRFNQLLGAGTFWVLPSTSLFLLYQHWVFPLTPYLQNLFPIFSLYSLCFVSLKKKTILTFIFDLIPFLNIEHLFSNGV